MMTAKETLVIVGMLIAVWAVATELVTNWMNRR